MAQRSGHMLDGLDAKASNCVNASTTYIRATIVLIPAIVEAVVMNTPATDSREYHVSQPTPTPSAAEAMMLVTPKGSGSAKNAPRIIPNINPRHATEHSGYP